MITYKTWRSSFSLFSLKQDRGFSFGQNASTVVSISETLIKHKTYKVSYLRTWESRSTWKPSFTLKESAHLFRQIIIKHRLH